MAGAVRAREVPARHSPRRAGGRALLDQESARLHRQQRRRLREHSRRLPPQRRRAPGLCVDQLGLRRQHQDAVLGAPERRSSAVALRGDQEGERADGAHVRAPLLSCRRPACASSPSTGRGAAPTWRCSCSRRTSSRASRSTSSTTATTAATSRTSTTSRGRRARHRSRRHSRTPEWNGDAPDPATSRRRTASTTSATTSRSS